MGSSRRKKVAVSPAITATRRSVMTLLNVLVVIALIATVVTLFGGIASMAHGGEYDTRHSTQFMLARVGAQGLALALLLIAVLMSIR
jgi:hypothetical protein